MNHEIAVEIERKGCEEKITLRWFVSLMGGCSPRMVFPLVCHGLGGFSGRGEREGVK
jgi:hypothetical protein